MITKQQLIRQLQNALIQVQGLDDKVEHIALDLDQGGYGDVIMIQDLHLDIFSTEKGYVNLIIEVEGAVKNNSEDFINSWTDRS